MKDNQMGGIALILGSMGFILTMSFHPSGHDFFEAGNQLNALITRTIIVHLPAAVSLPILFLGALALSRSLASPDRLSIIAIVAYGFAVFSAMSNVVVDGFVAPSLLGKLVAATPPASDMWHVLSTYNGYLNEVYAKIFVMASSAAIVLWSIAILRNRRLGVGAGIYGVVLGPAIVILLASGQLMLAAHWFRLIIFAQVAWFIIVGVRLLRLKETDIPLRAR
jgi:hypothetical protein